MMSHDMAVSCLLVMPNNVSIGTMYTSVLLSVVVHTINFAVVSVLVLCIRSLHTTFISMKAGAIHAAPPRLLYDPVLQVDRALARLNTGHKEASASLPLQSIRPLPSVNVSCKSLVAFLTQSTINI